LPAERIYGSKKVSQTLGRMVGHFARYGKAKC